MEELDPSEHICPISKEAGLPPRRSSIDVERVPTAHSQERQQHCFDSEGASGAAIRPSGVQLPADQRSAVWHPSSTLASSLSLRQKTAAVPDATAHDTASGHPAPQKLQQLAAACVSRDVKLLQALLPSSEQYISDPLDAGGDTALHAVLLPYLPAAASVLSAANVSGDADVNSNTRSWSCLFSCFGATAASSARLPCSFRPLSAVAAAAAQHSMVSSLLSAGADANVRNMLGQTPLMLAVQALIAACSSSGASSSTTSGPVAAALKVLELLCRHVLIEPNMKDRQGRTALSLLLLGSTHAASPGFSSTFDPGSTSSHFSIQSSASQAAAAAAAAGPNPALSAAQLKGVQMLLHAGADCNAADNAGVTPLMFAAGQPMICKELLQLLLQRGANTRQLDNLRRSALTHALLAHNLKLLPARGTGHASSSLTHCGPSCCSCGIKGGKSSLPAAAAASAARANGCSDLIPAATADQACAGAAAADGDVPVAASSASSDNCDSCASPDLHAQVHYCPSCSAYTCSSHNYSHSHGQGCNSSSVSSSGLTNPRHGTVIRALCSYGALDLHPASINTRFPGLNSFTQLHIAMRRGDVVAAQMLLAGGADVNAVDVCGNSPLMYWPVVPQEPSELVEELVGKLLSHVSVCGDVVGGGWDRREGCGGHECVVTCFTGRAMFVSMRCVCWFAYWLCTFRCGHGGIDPVLDC